MVHASAEPAEQHQAARRMEEQSSRCERDGGASVGKVSEEARGLREWQSIYRRQTGDAFVVDYADMHPPTVLY